MFGPRCLIWVFFNVLHLREQTTAEANNVKISSEISVRQSTNGNGVKKQDVVPRPRHLHVLEVVRGRYRWRWPPLMPEESVFKKKSVIVVKILPRSIKPQV